MTLEIKIKFPMDGSKGNCNISNAAIYFDRNIIENRDATDYIVFTVLLCKTW